MRVHLFVYAVLLGLGSCEPKKEIGTKGQGRAVGQIVADGLNRMYPGPSNAGSTSSTSNPNSGGGISNPYTDPPR